MAAPHIQTYAEFWPYYLGEHRKAVTRWMHFTGSHLAISTLIALFATGRGAWFLLALVPGYGLAWISHFCIEKNRPATFKYPWWSLLSDFKMMGLMYTGGIAAELDRIRPREDLLDAPERVITV